MSWNREYRPHTVNDLHLTAVREYFLSLLKADTLPQVFLFAGPKGTGKTSTARILAALLNDPRNAEAVTERLARTGANKNTTAESVPLLEPDDSNTLVKNILTGNSYVVHELDAASNRGIDDIRALKERISLPPAQGIVSVYILDEVHMLTTEAFNALLKLLEEPPAHVVFILATTELHKIVPTVVSRCQVVAFKRASIAELTQALKNILSRENLTAEQAVLDAVCARAEGSFRDAVKLLEMIHQQGALDVATAEKVLHLSHTELAEQIVAALLAKDAPTLVLHFQTARELGVSADVLHATLLQLLYAELMKALQVSEGETKIPSKTSIFLLKEFASQQLRAACPIPLLPLELACLDLIERSVKKSKETETAGTPPTTPHTAYTQKPLPTRAATQKRTSEAVVEKELPEYTAPTPPPAHHELLNPGDGEKLCADWATVLDLAVKTNFGLATLLKSARPISGETGKLTVSVFYKFHQEQLQQPKFYALIQEVFSKIAGGTIELECLLSEEPQSAELKEPTHAAPALAELAVASLM